MINKLTYRLTLIYIFLVSISQVWGQVTNTTTNVTYSTIQDAINNSNNNDVITVGDGTYPENLEINKDITIQSVNLHGAVIQTQSGFNAGSGYGGITFLADGATLDGFRVEQNVSQAIIHTHNSNHVSILNNEIVGIANGPRGVDVGYAGQNSDDVLIQGNNFDNTGCGVYINQATNVTIDNNIFNLADDNVWDVGAVIIDGTWVYNNIAVTNNALNTVTNFVDYLFVLATDGNTGITTHSGNNLNGAALSNWIVRNTDKNIFYPTLNAGTNDSDPGNTIEISTGTTSISTWTTIGHALTITGAGVANTTVEINSSWFNNGSNYALKLNEQNISISGIHFKVVGKGQGNILGLFKSYTSISGNKFSGEYVYGDPQVTRATLWSANPMTNMLFDNNIVESLRQPGYLSNGSGTISNNSFTTTRGWVIEGVGTLSFSGNIFGANTSHITILATASNISGLSISNNDFSGAVVDWAIDNRTTGTASAECNWYGSKVASVVASKISGPVDYEPWLVSGNDDQPGTPGFQPEAGACSGTPVEITSTTPSPETCVHDNGSIAIVYSGGTANYTIVWGGPESGSDVSNNTTYTIPTLSAGSYSITITDANGSTSTANMAVEYQPVTNLNTSATYATIQSAIDAATAGDVIEVCAGTYPENVIVSKAVTLKGANADLSCFGSRGSESVIAPATGLPLSVTASNVTINGFEMTAPGNPNAVQAENIGNLTFKFNNIHDVGTTVTTSNVHAFKFWTPNTHVSNIKVTDNCFNNIGNATILQKSASAITFGETTDFGNISTLKVQRNKITQVNSSTKGAYGILVGLGVSGGGQIIFGLIENNEINNLSGGWAHGIGLEGLTPGMQVKNNIVNEVSSSGTDNVCVMIEDNPNEDNIIITNNSFTGSGAFYGINNTMSGNLDNATCNWYGSASDIDVIPRVLGSVTYVPWLVDGTDTQPSTPGFQPATGICTGTPLVLVAANIVQETCGGDNGSIALSYNGGTAPYAITWSGAETGSDNTNSLTYTISNLIAGNYSITITDANGSIADTSIVIEYQPVTNLNTSVTYATIQAAIDAATAGDVIEVCAGTLALQGTVTVNKSLTIQGQGRDNTVVELPSSWFNNGSLYGFSLGADNITIQDIHFKVVGKGSGNILALLNSGAHIHNNKFSGEYVFGDPEVTRATVWSASNNTGMLMDSNIVESLRQPGYLSNGSGTISNNTVNNTRGWVIEGVGTLDYTGNIFGTNTSHITILNTATDISGLTLNENDLSGAVTDWAIDNRTTQTANATCNWYGTTDNNIIAAKISGPVDYAPWLINGTDDAPLLEGFQPVPGSCIGSPVEITSVVDDQIICGETTGSINVSWTGGVANYIVSWTGGSTSGLTGNSYNITGLAAGSYTITVTDSYSNSDIAAPVTIQYLPVFNTTNTTYYPTIQAAIDAATAGDIIDVCAGTYAEDLVVNKSVTLLGPNATINPCSDTRAPEAIIVPATTSISSREIIHVAASDVTISGFLIDGDNSALTSGFTSTNGADIDAAEGITVYENNISNLTVQNNIIQNLSYFGVTLFGATYGAPETHGHVVSNNLIRNMGTYDASSGIANWGGGVLLYNNQYTHVYENCIQNARIGIQTGNFQKVNSGTTDFQLIENNTIEARALGIFYNLHNYSPFTIKDNTITALFNSDELPASTKSWKGLLIASLGNNMGLSNIDNNSVDGIGLTNAWTRGSEGINVWNVTNTARPIITGGTLTNVDKGIFVNNFEGYNSDGSYGSYADISKVTVSNADEGIVVYDSPNSTSHSSVNATAINNYISADTGIRLAETTSGTVNGTFHENHITGFTTYAINSTVSNTVDATCNWYGTTSSNAIAAAITGAVNYTPWLVSGVDSDPGTQGFQPGSSACSGTSIEITSTTSTPETCTKDNGTITLEYTGGTADYTIAWSGPESGNDMTAANNYTIPTLVAGNYVITITDVNGSSVTTTVAVEYHPVTNQTTSATYATIQAAIDAATAGDVIDVCAGTYKEHIKIDKSLSLIGPNDGIDPCSGSRRSEAVIYPPISDIAYNTDDGALIDVQASDVTISGFLLDGDNPDISTGFTSTNGADIDAASGIVRYNTGDNLVITNNIIQNLSYFGVTLYDYPAGVPSAGNIIANNQIQDLGTYDAGSGIDYWGGGVLLYNNQYTYVHDNCMTNVRTGIQTGNYSKANPGTTNDQLIANNTMTVRRRGIFHNLAYSNASAYTLSDNTITGLMDGHETVWDGILLSSLSVPSTTSNNSINGAGITNPSEGIEVWNVKNNAPAAINGGSISGVSTGIFMNNYEGYSSNGADGAHAAVSGVSISATDIGVYLHDHPSSTHGQVSGSFTGCTITSNEGIRTVESMTGATAGDFNTNTINADSLGINITGAGLSSTNALSISDNTVTLSGQDEGNQPTVGIQLGNLTGSAAATISNNTVSGSMYGYVGYNINTAPVTTINGGTVSGIMQGIAVVNTDGVTTVGSSIDVSNVSMNGFTGTSTNSAINFHAGIYTFTTVGTTPAEGITMSINQVTIDGTGKPSQASGGIYLADFSGGSSNVQDITVNNSSIINNANRGFDARGKVNLTLTANTITNNGFDAWGTGGNNGFSVIAQQEANITATNNFIKLPATSSTEVYGLFTGNGTSNSITAHDNSILLNGNANSGSRLASSSAGTGTIDATCNWWGTVVVNDLASMISGNVTYTPWLINGTDDQPGTPGFQPVSGACSGIPIAVTVDGVIDALCTTGQNGSILISVTGGISPYTYLWSDGQTTEDAVSLTPGVFTVTVTDDFGNTGTATTTVGVSPVVNTSTLTGYNTIQAAIDAATEGDVIDVCAGKYMENLSINKAITLHGAGRDLTTVQAVTSSPVLKIDGNSPTINGDVTIDGFTFRDTTHSVTYIVQTDHLPSSTTLLFTNNRITQADKYGWWDYHSQGNLECTYNIFSDLYMGMLIEQWENGIVDISNNEFTALHYWKVNGVPNPAYRPSTIYAFTYNGVNCINPYSIIENNIHDYTDGGYGVVINGGFAGQDPAYYGEMNISGNVIKNIGLEGIRLRNYPKTGSYSDDPLGGVQNATILNNEISGIDDGIKVLGGNPGTGIHDNSITAITNKAISLLGSSIVVNATCNWYGATDGGNISSKIDGNVTYSPWLVNGTDNDLINIGFQPVPNSCSGSLIEIVSATPAPETCTKDDGSIALTYSGGTANYTIAWSGAESGTDVTGNTNYSIANLSAGSYTITITDVNGSTATTTVAVEYHPVTNQNTSVTYATIQAAIDAATAGDVIDVCAGTYNENVVVNKSLTLKGAQFSNDPRPSIASTRIIDDASESIIISPKNKNVIKIEANDVVIDGFELKQSGGSGSADAIKASNTQSDIQITNNIVYNSTDEGIQLEAGSDYLVQYNYIKNPAGDGITMSSYSGVDPNSQPGVNIAVKDNDIEGSTSAYGSVYLYGVRNVTVSGNMITTRSSGIIVGSDGLPVSNALIENNTIKTEMHSAYSAYAMGIGIDGNGDNIQILNNYIDDIGDGDLVHSNAYPNNFGLIYVGPGTGANPTNVSVQNNYLYRFVDHNYIFVKGSVTDSIEANCNWWNSTDLTTILSRMNGKVDFCTFLDSGTDSDPGAKGMQPGGSCVDKMHAATASLTGAPTYSYCYGDDASLTIDFDEYNGVDWAEPITVTMTVLGADAATYTIVKTETAQDWRTGISISMNIPGFIGTNTITGLDFVTIGCTYHLDQSEVLTLLGTDQFTVNPAPLAASASFPVGGGAAEFCFGDAPALSVDIDDAAGNDISGNIDITISIDAADGNTYTPIFTATGADWLTGVTLPMDVPGFIGTNTITGADITTAAGCTAHLTQAEILALIGTDQFIVHGLPESINTITTACSGTAMSYDLNDAITNPSQLAGVDFVWVATDNSNVSGESLTQQSGDLLTDKLINTTSTTQTVVYTVTPTSGYSCVGMDFTVSVNIEPQPVTVNGTVTQCSEATWNIDLTPYVTNGVYGTMTWTRMGDNIFITGEPVSGTGTNLVSGIVINNAAYEQSENYQVIVSNGSGCVTDTFTLTVKVGSRILISTSANGPATICENVDRVITAFVVGGTAPYTYNWSVKSTSGVTADFNGGENTQSPTVNFAGNGTITLEVYAVDNKGCQSTSDTLKFTVLAAPTVKTIVGNTAVCNTTSENYNIDSPDPLNTYTWTLYSGGTITSPNVGNAITISWNTGNQGPHILGVVEKNPNGCETAYSINIMVNQLPNATFTMSVDTPVIEGDMATVTINGLADGTYDIDYTLAVDPQASVTATSASGVLTFTTRALTLADDSTNIVINTIAFDGSGCSINTSKAHIITVLPAAVDVHITVMLSGAYSTGTHQMKTTLNDKGLLPLSQPYNVAPFNYTGTESVATMPPDVVDWILVTLRDGSEYHTVVQTKAALLHKDGSVTDTDGNPLSYVVDRNLDYYVEIQHRNHIGVLTANPIDFYSPPTLDFTDTGVTPTYGTSAQKEVETGVMALNGGNVNSNGNVRYSGPNNDHNALLNILGGNPSAILTNVYSNGDINMDGNVRYSGPSNDHNFLISYVLNSNPSLILLKQY